MAKNAYSHKNNGCGPTSQCPRVRMVSSLLHEKLVKILETLPAGYEVMENGRTDSCSRRRLESVTQYISAA